METNGRIHCGCGSELSFSAADSRPRCECGALYAVTVTQLLGEGDVRACANCGGGADSRRLLSTDEWRREMALCEVCAVELREEAGTDVPE